MDINEFEEQKVEGKKVLESLLFNDDSASSRIKQAVLDLGLKKASLGNQRNRIAIPLSLITHLSKHSGAIEYICYHEIGEVTYLLPLLKQLGTTRIKEIPAPPPSISQISASDVYGDLLASTLSPLSPEKQERAIFDRYVKIPGLSRKENGFLRYQAFIFLNYMDRECEGYSYGEELKDFYQRVLILQRGLSGKERKEFQLRLYNIVQDKIKEKLAKRDSVKYEDIPRIIFNKEELLSALEC